MKTAAAKGQHRGPGRNPLYLGNDLVLLGVVAFPLIEPIDDALLQGD